MTVKNRFLDPETGDDYTWHINHGWDGDDNQGIENSVTWTSTTAGVQIPQFGSARPQIWTLRGTILHRAQHEAFLGWAALASDRSIYFRDFDSVEYEVFIQKYSWQRVGVSRNLSDDTMQFNIFRYTLELVVYGLAP